MLEHSASVTSVIQTKLTYALPQHGLAYRGSEQRTSTNVKDGTSFPGALCSNLRCMLVPYLVMISVFGL